MERRIVLPVKPLVSTSLLAATLFWASIAVWVLGGPRGGRKSAHEVRRDRGTVALIIGSVGLAIGLGLAAAANVPSLAIPASRWPLLVAGLAVMWIGIGLVLWATYALGRFYRPVVTIHEDHEVVTGGPYRFVRHPIYAGAIVVMVGVGLALGNWLSLLVCVLVPLPAYLTRIRIEEHALEDDLGERYRRYAEGKARLVPGIW